MKDKRLEGFRSELESIIKKYKILSIHDLDSVGHEILLRNAIARKNTSRETARELGIGKSTMYRKIKHYGIESKT